MEGMNYNKFREMSWANKKFRIAESFRCFGTRRL